MPSLNICGFDLPIKADTLEVKPVEIGDTNRGVTGALRTGRRASKREWSFETRTLTEEQARMWRGLLVGRGHYWSFDSTLNSSGGLAPSSNVGCSITTTKSRAGAGCMLMTATTGLITWLTGITGTWSIGMFRADAVVGGGYVGYIQRSDGMFWTGSGLSSGSMPGLTSTQLNAGGTGELRLAVGTAADRTVDELWILPWLVPSYLATAITASPSVAHQLGPTLPAYGDAVSGSSASAPAYVVGSVRGAAHLQGAIDSEFSPNMQSLVVTLTEV